MTVYCAGASATANATLTIKAGSVALANAVAVSALTSSNYTNEMSYDTTNSNATGKVVITLSSESAGVDIKGFSITYEIIYYIK